MQPFPHGRHARRFAAFVGVAVLTGSLAAGPAAAREVTEDGLVPWRAGFTRVPTVPLVRQKVVRFAYEATGAQTHGTVSLRISTRDGLVVRWVAAEPTDDVREGRFRWDGLGDDGQPVENGLYLARLVAYDDRGDGRASDAYGVRVQRPTMAAPVYRVDGVGRRVALTFDDCTFGEAWRQILSLLEDRGLLASFFCSGSMVQTFPRLAQRTAAAGHTIGDHGYFHRNLTTLGVEGIESELEGTVDAWWNVAGTTPIPYVRPPYGSFDAQVLAVAGECGFPEFVLWDVDPSDWTRPGAAAITSRVLSRVRPGSIVLLHVLPETAAALPGILKGLRRMDLHPVSLEELLRDGTPSRTQ